MSGVVIHRSSRAVAARHPVRQPPQPRVAETVIDLAQSVRAVNNRLTTVDRLRDAIAARAKVRWRRLLLAGLGDVAAGCRSVLEPAYVRAAHPFDHRFQDMRRDNHAVVVGDGTLRYGAADITRRCCEVAREVGGVLTCAGWPAKPVSRAAESCVIP